MKRKAKSEEEEDQTPRKRSDKGESQKKRARLNEDAPGSKHIKEEDVKQEEAEELDYEALRERNIRMREQMFQELGLDEARDQADASPASAVKKATPSRRGLVVKKEVEILPPRKSLRLQNIDADTGIKLPDKEPTAYHVYQPVDDNPRPSLGDLQLEDIVSSAEKGIDIQEKKAFLTSTAASLPTVTTYSGSSSFSEDVAKQLEALRLPAENVAKVVPNRIFSLAVHPSTDKLLVAAGGKWGNVGLWDVRDNTSNNHGVQLFKMHSRPVNCMTFNKWNNHQLWTASYDGTVRSFDIERQMVTLLYGNEDEDLYVTYHAQLDASTFLVTMGTSGKVGLVDERISCHKAAQIMQVFEKGSPKTVSVHPVKQNLFVCPNNKGECKLFDMRTAKSKAVMKATTTYSGHTKALSSAMISPVTGANLVTVAYDNKVRVFDTETSKLKASIAHNNQTGRWLTTFKAEWHPLRDDLFFVGSMNQPRQIDAFSDTGRKYPALKADDLASVCSIVKCHPTSNVVVGGNSSGRVHVLV